MSRPLVLSEVEIAARLAEPGLSGWRLESGKLRREYDFEDFVHAFGLMATAAIAIEAMNHHPEWSNVYNKVTIALVTHDAGGVTALDLLLAERLEQLARKLGATAPGAA